MKNPLHINPSHWCCIFPSFSIFPSIFPAHSNVIVCMCVCVCVCACVFYSFTSLLSEFFVFLRKELWFSWVMNLISICIFCKWRAKKKKKHCRPTALDRFLISVICLFSNIIYHANRCSDQKTVGVKLSLSLSLSLSLAKSPNPETALESTDNISGNLSIKNSK